MENIGVVPTLAREDYTILRHLFGLQPNTSQSTLFIPQISSLATTLVKDVVLIAVDVEAPLVEKGCIDHLRRYQIGLSIFDTRTLLSIQHLPQACCNIEAQVESAIQTHSFCFGNVEYTAKASRRFLFGISENVCLKELKVKIDALVPKDRHIVVVAHCGLQDLRFLQGLEVCLQPACIIDTQKVAQTVLVYETM